MKKLFCLLLAFCALHAVIAQGWEQITRKNRWGDDSGIVYNQVQFGNDSKNKYGCGFGFSYYEDGLVFVFTSKIAGDFAIHPGYDIFGGKDVTIQFRKDGAIQTFHGVTTKNDSPDWLNTAFVGEAAASIAKLLKGNGTWDVLVEGSNWYVRTKVTGNLPLSFDEKDALILSADGKTVTGVKSWYKNSLESVVIPNGVTSIGGRAFWCCENLKTVTLPDSITEIGKSAFLGCSALREISLPKRLTKISETAFAECSSLQTINIPDSVTEIEPGAFVECYGLQEVSLPKRLTKIGNGTFIGCRSLQTIKIPNSVTEIGKSAFDDCPTLKNLQSAVCSIQNGFVIHNNTINGILDIRLESYIVPAKIEAIDFEVVFGGCENLKSIIVPKTVKLTNVPRTVQVIRN